MKKTRILLAFVVMMSMATGLVGCAGRNKQTDIMPMVAPTGTVPTNTPVPEATVKPTEAPHTPTPEVVVTEEATETPEPTAEATPTEAITPTEIATLTVTTEPTPTAVPTETPTTAPTVTPIPVATLEPTATPKPTNSPKPTATPIKTITKKFQEVVVGDYVLYGNYEQDTISSNGKEPIEWLVLAKKDDKILLLSKYILDNRKYNDVLENTNWKKCTLRSWLNKEFYNTAFDSNEKKYIAEMLLDNTDFYNYTENKLVIKDKVSLLSGYEAYTYQINAFARRAKPTDYAISQGADPCSKDWWFYEDSMEAHLGYDAWLLRSTSSDQGAGVEEITMQGNYVSALNYVNTKMGIRPVICVESRVTEIDVNVSVDSTEFSKPTTTPIPKPLVEPIKLGEIKVGDIIEFGSYPQNEWYSESEVSEEVKNADYDSNGYAIIAGKKYRKVNLKSPEYVYVEKLILKAPYSGMEVYIDNNIYSEDDIDDKIKKNVDSEGGCAIINNKIYGRVDVSMKNNSNWVENNAELSKNDICYFVCSPIEWEVLDIKNGKALLISKYCLDQGVYNKPKYSTNIYEEGYENTTWEECTLREWLNNVFYFQAFNDFEKATISITENINPDNKDKFIYGGNNTYDNVFVLSSEEVTRCFSENIEVEHPFLMGFFVEENPDRYTTPTLYACAKGVICDENERCGWILRSQSSQNAPYFVNGKGIINDQLYYSGGSAIRPAIWVDIY